MTKKPAGQITHSDPTHLVHPSMAGFAAWFRIKDLEVLGWNRLSVPVGPWGRLIPREIFKALPLWL